MPSNRPSRSRAGRAVAVPSSGSPPGERRARVAQHEVVGRGRAARVETRPERPVLLVAELPDRSWSLFFALEDDGRLGAMTGHIQHEGTGRPALCARAGRTPTWSSSTADRELLASLAERQSPTKRRRQSPRRSGPRSANLQNRLCARRPSEARRLSGSLRRSRPSPFRRRRSGASSSCGFQKL